MAQWFEIQANRRALVYILFSAVVLGAIFFAGISPAKKQTARIQVEALELEARIEQQRVLKPLYARLQESMAHGRDLTEILPASPGAGEARFSIHTASLALADMAGSSGLYERRFTPVPASAARDSDVLLVNAVLQGPYDHFRDFLLTLVTSPAFHSLESLAIRATTADPEYRLKVWIKID